MGIKKWQKKALRVINIEIYSGMFSGSNMKYAYGKQKILQAQLFFKFQYGRHCS